MEQFEGMFQRATLQNIGGMIRLGGMTRFEAKTFDQRIEAAYQELTEALTQYVDEEKMDEVDTAINGFILAHIEVYFNAGIKVGAQLQVQLLTNPENDYL